MKIRRYFFPMYAGVPDDPNGDWVKYEDVEPLLERIEELEGYYNGDVKLLLTRIKEL